MSGSRDASATAVPGVQTGHPIGEVADLLRLSLRTLRYWEEVGLVVPSRGAGGSRTYTDEDIDRLRFVRAMKPTDLTIDELRDLLRIYADLRDGAPDRAVAAAGAAYSERIRARCDVLETRIAEARVAADELDRLVAQAAAPST